MLFKIVVVFEIFGPKIPFYLTFYLNYGMIRLRLTRATIPLLKLISNYLKVKLCLLKTFDPF